MATIQQIYIALFGRPADPNGLDFYQDRTNNGANLEPILAQLANSPEYLDRFAGQSQSEIIEQIYLDLFNRPADDEGRDFYLARLESGEMNIANIAVAILDGAQNDDAEIVANKTAYANAFTASLDTDAEASAYDPGTVMLARDFLSDIGADDDMVDQGAVDAVIADIVEAGGDNVFTLTGATGEALVGTDAADVFNGVIGGDDATVNNFDSIDGRGGNDTLNLIAYASDNEISDPIDPEIDNVETVNTRFVETGAAVSLANATGVEMVSASNSTTFGGYSDLGDIGNFSVSDQGAVGFEGTDAETINLTLTNVVDADFSDANLELATIDFDDIVADRLNVTVSDSVAALGIANIANGVQGEDAVESVSINSTGSTGLNVVGMSGTTNMTDITLTGDQSVIVVGGSVADGAMPTDGIQAATEFDFDGFTAIETVTATGLSGDLTLDVSNATGDVTFRSGSGNDTIATGEGDDLLVGGGGNDMLTGGAGDDIYGGGGGNDTIDLTGGGNDEVHFDAGTGTDSIEAFDASGAGIDVISFLQDGAITFANSDDDDDRGDADLDAADYQVRDSIGDTMDMDDQKVVQLNDTFNTSELTGTLGAAAEFYLVAQNSDTGEAEIYYDADWSDSTGRQHIASIVGVDAADLSIDNFDIYV